MPLKSIYNVFSRIKTFRSQYDKSTNTQRTTSFFPLRSTIGSGSAKVSANDLSSATLSATR